LIIIINRIINYCYLLTEGTVQEESSWVQHSIGWMQAGTCYGEFWLQKRYFQVNGRESSTLRWSCLC